MRSEQRGGRVSDLHPLRENTRRLALNTRSVKGAS